MNIRNVNSSDYRSVKKIKPSLDTVSFKERLERQKSGYAEFLVLEDKNQLVSFVFVKWGGKKTHPEYPDMEDLYTKESKRGKGYATLLITECEKRAKEKGFKEIGLAANPTENPKARSLYERLGYKSTGEKSYLDGIYDGVEDWVIDLEKEI